MKRTQTHIICGNTFPANVVSEIVDQYVLKLDNFEKKTFWVFWQAVFTECF